MVRIAIQSDLPAIVAIYNQAIAAGCQTAFTQQVTVEERRSWFAEHDPYHYPVFVFEQDGIVCGWLSVSPYRQGREALRTCVEISYFVDGANRKKGIGSELLSNAIVTCDQMGYKQLLAIIIGNNVASIRLMERFGFEKWGVLPGVYNYSGVICDHLYYGKTLQ